MTTRNSMLAIAREAIDGRAVHDGYASSEYDAVSDAEGYVTSILNALHHWCAAHKIDWQAELARAQELFEEDLQEESADVFERECRGAPDRKAG